MKKIFSLFVAMLFSVAMFADIWTVAGSSTDLFGTSWDPSNTDNEMALVGSIYQWQKSAVTLGASTIQFKVVKGHNWGEEYGDGSDNFKLTIAEDGVYDVTITFDPSSKAIIANAEKKGSAVVIPTIKLHGDFTDDDEVNWADTEEFQVAANEETSSLTLHLYEGTWYFGVKKNNEWTANGAEFSRANSAHVVEAGEGDLSIVVDQEGDYTFTWTFATNTLAVTYPTLLRKFFITGDSAFVVNAGLTVDKKWNPKAFKSEADSYTFKNLAAGIYAIKITIDGTWDTAKGYDDLSDKTDAGLTSKGGDISFRLLEPADVTITYTADPEVFTVTTTGSFFSKEAGYYLIGEFSGVAGWAVENLVAEKKFTATVEEGQYSLLVTLAEGDLIKVVKVSNNAIETWYGNTNYEITDAYAGKKIIYFKPAKDGSWSQLDGYIWIGDDPTTAIDEVEGAVKAVKRVVNGQLVIEREGKFYNALGAEVK